MVLRNLCQLAIEYACSIGEGDVSLILPYFKAWCSGFMQSLLGRGLACPTSPTIVARVGEYAALPAGVPEIAITKQQSGKGCVWYVVFRPQTGGAGIRKRKRGEEIGDEGHGQLCALWGIGA